MLPVPDAEPGDSSQEQNDVFLFFCFNWYLFALLLLVIVRFLCYCDRCIVIVCCLSSCDCVCVRVCSVCCCLCQFPA